MKENKRKKKMRGFLRSLPSPNTQEHPDRQFKSLQIRGTAFPNNRTLVDGRILRLLNLKRVGRVGFVKDIVRACVWLFPT